MNDETCILCGRPFPAGLHIMGCMICFPCEKQLIGARVSPRRRRRLRRLYTQA